VALLGITGARERLKDLVGEADRALAPFGTDAAMLKATARFVAERNT
jgi:farnesyl diphosphate synthase